MLIVCPPEYSQNLILPTKGSTNLSQSQNSSRQTADISNRSGQTAVNDGQVSRQPKDLSVKQLTLAEEFFCTPDDLYKVLTTKEVSCTCFFAYCSLFQQLQRFCLWSCLIRCVLCGFVCSEVRFEISQAKRSSVRYIVWFNHNGLVF